MHPSATPSASTREERSALIAGFAAFGTWGLIPIYWKLLKTFRRPKSSRTVASGRPFSWSSC